jgi:glutathione S-transferase
MELFAHPFSSYSWKVLIALYERDLPFRWRLLEPADPDTQAEHRMLWPIGKMPVLRYGARVLAEASIIIEFLDGVGEAPPLLPAGTDAALRVRMLDRVFDNYVMSPMQKIVADHLRPAHARDGFGVAEARAQLRTAYAWLDGQLGEDGWACGAFSLADCAAAPALFYADWVEPIAAAHPRLQTYRARLLARPSVARAVDEARPYRAFFPPGAPDRD